MGIIKSRPGNGNYKIKVFLSKPEAFSYVWYLLLHMLAYFNMIANIVLAVINSCRVILLSIHHAIVYPHLFF